MTGSAECQDQSEPTVAPCLIIGYSKITSELLLVLLYSNVLWYSNVSGHNSPLTPLADQNMTQHQDHHGAPGHLEGDPGGDDGGNDAWQM